METLGIYIQVPFCASKCTFCNFSSEVAPAPLYDAYIAALEQELSVLPGWVARESIRPDLLRLPVDTLYLGGGTPSLLGVARLQWIWRLLRERFQFSASPESCVEITPRSANHALLECMLELGVNRLSIGAQSFDERELRCVGRLHSAADIAQQVSCARQAGFGNISLDLLAGLPHQTAQSWRKSLEEAVSLQPEHVSVYLFEVDEKSRLGGEVLRGGKRYHADSAPGEDFMAGAYEVAQDFLAHVGYAQYEISNFALPGYESRHNQKYWQLKPYLGLGAGAHSFDGERRWANEVTPDLYRNKLDQGRSPVAESRRLSAVERAEEFLFLGLRQRRGVRLEQARRLWETARSDEWEHKVRQLRQDGWLTEEGGWLSLSEPAYLVSNEIFQQFLVC